MVDESLAVGGVQEDVGEDDVVQGPFLERVEFGIELTADPRHLRSGDPAVRPERFDQVDQVAAREGLAELLDREAPLGPEQDAARLGVRRVDFEWMRRLGWIAPVSRAGALPSPDSRYSRPERARPRP